jgi:hypothetical protein
MKLKLQVPQETRAIPHEWYRFFSDLVAALGLHKGAPILPSMTETERDELDAQPGMEIYNTTADQAQIYEAGSWRQL